VFQFNPRVLLEKAFDRSTFVHRGIVEYDDKQRLRESLVKLVEECQKYLGRAPLGPFPVAALGTEV
jgi:hypothetical protein